MLNGTEFQEIIIVEFCNVRMNTNTVYEKKIVIYDEVLFGTPVSILLAVDYGKGILQQHKNGHCMETNSVTFHF